MRATPHLLWLLLTKRPQNAVAMCEAAGGLPKNAALGATVEDQKRAINLFHLGVAAWALRPAFTFASFEPLIEPVDPTRVVLHEGAAEFFDNPAIKTARILFDALRGAPSIGIPALGWAITGGETDQGGHKARPTHPDWFRAIRDACAAAHVPYHHKQNGEWAPSSLGPNIARLSSEERVLRDGEWTGHGLSPNRASAPDTMNRVGKRAAGRLLDGKLHDAMPEVRHADR